MKKKPKNITTIEGLATRMHNEFLAVHEKFSSVDARFDQMEERFDSLEVGGTGNSE